MTIKATPYNGAIDVNETPLGIPGVSYETTIQIIHSGKLTFGDSVVSRDLNPIQIEDSENAANYYYGTTDGMGTNASTADQLEVDNVNKVAITLVENTNGVSIVFIYDEPNALDAGGPQRNACVEVLKDGKTTLAASQLVFSDNPQAQSSTAFSLASSGSVTHFWQTGDNDGFGIGPFPAYTTICFDFYPCGAAFYSSGGRFFDVADDGSVKATDLASSSSDLLSKEICITTPESL